jgi:hypothetical protein
MAWRLSYAAAGFLAVLGSADPMRAQETMPIQPQSAPKSQEVNAPGKPQTACPCALAGQHGGCLVREQLQKVRDAATIDLPACRKEATALAGLAAAEAKRGDAAKARGDLLASAVADLKGLPQASPPPSRARWFAIGMATAAGIVALTLAIYPRLAPTRTTESAVRAPVLGRPILSW